ncbi:hypothetical protein EJ08DRAFT_697288 [Tothia fuscella]|uniref:Uncharacterized protein n=1 Tax=Tothia fuscella TaxID=1048955 RepID=A0A9P4NSL3_9PEZI|nr:hypothetical protein EJ08DRAFT_697288 [Tothia fuscella]
MLHSSLALSRGDFGDFERQTIKACAFRNVLHHFILHYSFDRISLVAAGNDSRFCQLSDLPQIGLQVAYVESLIGLSRMGEVRCQNRFTAAVECTSIDIVVANRTHNPKLHDSTAIRQYNLHPEETTSVPDIFENQVVGVIPMTGWCEFLSRPAWIPGDRIDETTGNQGEEIYFASDKRVARDPQRQAQARQDVRVFARELIHLRRTSARLLTSKAQLGSVPMQINEAYAVKKIEGSIRTSVATLQRAHGCGNFEEMVGDILPEEQVEVDYTETEVDQVLKEILKDSTATAGTLPSIPDTMTSPTEEQEEEFTQAKLMQMRTRLETLKS